MNYKQIIDFLREFEVQVALGTASKYKNKFTEKLVVEISPGKRKCHFCGGTINKGEKCYSARNSLYLNVCIDCSWMSLKSMLKMVGKENDV